MPHHGYCIEIECKGTASDVAGVKVYWYQANRTTASATPSSTATVTLDGNNQYYRGSARAPSDAKWAELRPYSSSGSDPIYFQVVNLYEIAPCFGARMSGDQAVAAQGATVVAFADVSSPGTPTNRCCFQYGETADYSTGSYYYATKHGLLYELFANVVVYSATDEQCPAHIDLYDAANSEVIAFGQTVTSPEPTHYAYFSVHSGPYYALRSGQVKVRYHAFGACTISSFGSWFNGRQLV